MSHLNLSANYMGLTPQNSLFLLLGKSITDFREVDYSRKGESLHIVELASLENTSSFQCYEYLLRMQHLKNIMFPCCGSMLPRNTKLVFLYTGRICFWNFLQFKRNIHIVCFLANWILVLLNKYVCIHSSCLLLAFYIGDTDIITYSC